MKSYLPLTFVFSWNMYHYFLRTYYTSKSSYTNTSMILLFRFYRNFVLPSVQNKKKETFCTIHRVIYISRRMDWLSFSYNKNSSQKQQIFITRRVWCKRVTYVLQKHSSAIFRHSWRRNKFRFDSFFNCYDGI